MRNQGDLITLTKNWMEYVESLSVVLIALISVIGIVGAIHTGKELYKFVQDEGNTRNPTTVIGYIAAFAVCAIMTMSSVFLGIVSLLYVK